MKEKMNSINKTARIAGFLYLLLAPLGFFGLDYIPSITVPENGMATVSNIMTHTVLFRLSILSALLIPIVTASVALFLYKLFKPVDKIQATLMVLFTLVATPIAMLNELNHFAVLLLLNGSEYLKVFSVDQLYSQVMFFLDLSHYGVEITGIFWGLWLLPLGYLILKSNFIPKLIGILMLVAGFGYIVDPVALFLLPDLNIHIAQFTFFGELVLLLWLLIKGVNVEQWEKRVVFSNE
jgi:hypothetical protein